MWNLKRLFWVSVKLKAYARYDICWNSWGKTEPIFFKDDKKLQHVPLEKLIVMTAGPGNIPHTPKQQAANGKDYVEEYNLFPGILGVAYAVGSQT